ncbi:hypothetical protein ACHAPM_010399 [Fusarium culmorum]|uniref:Fungal N-terminal domain-containing protein n=1 Tax=Fusarium culmorum TaxID=5516 RepID=A0A2T4H6Z9_FUSCU|nr:hypothetical protein FCULG_00002846 [Fusarium culmorum]
MAELIGLVASIGTITAARFKAAKAIFTIASELGAAGTEMSGIATDLKAISLILNELKKRLNKAENITVEFVDVAYEIVALCKTDIEGVECFLAPLNSPSGQKLKLNDKVKWLFGKAKVSSRRASLDSLKLTLSLFLHTLDFIENGDDGSEDVAHAKPKDAALTDALALKSSIHDEEQMQLTRPRSQTDSAIFLETMSDSDFVEISEHLRLQKIVRELALKTTYPTQEQEAQSTSFDDADEIHTHNWRDDDAEYGNYTFPPSKGRLEQELKNTKTYLNKCLVRIKLLDKVVATYEAESDAHEEEQRRQKEKQNRQEEDSLIRKEAEEAFQRRMEDMRLAQEEAKREIEKARLEAEKAATEMVEEKQKAEQRRQKDQADAIAAAKETERREFEAEVMGIEERELAKKQPQMQAGLKKYFPMLRNSK